MFKENPLSKAKSPLDSNDHPKTDTMECLGKESIQMYQLLAKGDFSYALVCPQFWALQYRMVTFHNHLLKILLLEN
jgi:hypothetical protein